MTKFYITRQDAIEQEIIPALGEFADQYDIEAIADDALTYVAGHGFDVAQDEEFWRIVERHDISATR